ncbi:MAG TPA: hypothetical protein VM260_28260, partial [Pirellula sp.]|nr:hypothetical protein [Pirellula sp.]
MKKPTTEIDTKGIATSNTILPELAKSFSCKLMEIALQLRNWSSTRDESVSIQEKIESLLDGFEESERFTTGVGIALVRLKTLSGQLQHGELQVRERNATEIDDEATQILFNAVHAVIAFLSQSLRMDDAV